jgi:hypothetical protein
VFAASILSVPVGIVAVVSSAASGGAQSAGPSPLITVASIVFIGVPMVILGTYLAPMPSAAAVEARGSAAALVRSFSLVAGNFGRTFLPFLIASTLSGGVAALLGQGGQALLKEPLQGWLGEANGALVASIPGSLAMLLLTPFMYTLQAVLYLDLRARKEEGDFSIDELAIDMGYAPPSETSGEVSVDSSPADDPES